MTKIDILGSCVTRDAFEFDGESSFLVNKYFARSSLASIYSFPLKINQDQIGLSSSFQRKMVLQDVTKELKNYIKNIKSDLLIIDFIDERFKIVRTSGDRYVTRSSEFLKSNINSLFKTGSVSEEDKLKMWETAAENFISDIKEYYNPRKIILHKAFWRQLYMNNKGEICNFEEETRRLIDKNNQELQYLYNFMEYKLDDINIIHIDEFVASENHKWGLQPFHYEDDYYIEFLTRLKNIPK